MSEPAAKSKTARKSKTAPVRLGRNALTGGYVLAPYPKKGGADPKVIRAAVEAVIASRKA